MKEAYFFSHDYNARQDPKMQEVLMDYGVAGIGIYWCIVEQLYEQGGRMALASIKAIAFALHVAQDDVRSIVMNYGLFDNDGTEFWSPSASRRLDERREIIEKRAKAATKRWSKNAKETDTDANASKNDANAMQMHKKNDAMHKDSDAMQCYIKESKVKEIKEKESNNKLSLCDDASEREKILYIFFFEKNFINPNEEVERFINHYEANGWCRNNSSVPVKDKMALARAWKPQKEGIRFPHYFNNWLKEVYWQAMTTEPDNAGIIMQADRCEETGNFNIALYCTREQAALIERNAVSSNLFKLSYRVRN